MRIVHTSDWHAGRVWKSIHRLDELEAVLGNLAEFIEREKVDLLLVSGDVFDTGTPSPKAERVVFEFLKRVGMAGTHSVVIAGNHDSPTRIEAWGLLAELVSVHAVGHPKPARDGGIIDVTVRSGERAIVAAIPFAPQRSLVSAIELAGDDTTPMQTYAEKLCRIAEILSQSFSSDAVNLLCAHTHLDGATWSGSERKVHLGDDWAAAPQSLPATAHYIALGHIHKPQKVSAPSPAYYAGSPLQMDFGEAGEEKSFVLIEAKAGHPAKIERVPYEGGRPLADLTLTFDEIQNRVEELGKLGWLKVTVPIEHPDPELNRKVRALLPNAVSIDAQLPGGDDVPMPEVLSLDDHAPREVFKGYFSSGKKGDLRERSSSCCSKRSGQTWRVTRCARASLC